MKNESREGIQKKYEHVSKNKDIFQNKKEFSKFFGMEKENKTKNPGEMKDFLNPSLQIQL